MGDSKESTAVKTTRAPYSTPLIGNTLGTEHPANEVRQRPYVPPKTVNTDYPVRITSSPS